MGDNVFGCFISQKVSKIRWKPEVMDDSEYFVTGSTDEEINQLTLWYYPLNDAEIDDLPYKKSSLSHEGDVTALEFLDTSTAVCSSSLGTVQLIRCTHDALVSEHAWDKLHSYSTGDLGVSTDVSCFDEDIASVGEDGCIALLTVSQKDPVRVIEKADSCPIMCVSFLKHNELVTGNFRGQLKIWDLRSADDAPLSAFMPSGEGGVTTCVTNHPTQRHLLLAGGQDGAVTVWDLRKSTYPVNVLNAHTATVSEIKFHPERPEHLFTCSWAGDVWQWNTNRNMREHGGEEVPWLSSDATKHRMEISSLMATSSKAVNSIDVNRTRLVSGCDNEAVYLIKNLLL